MADVLAVLFVLVDLWCPWCLVLRLRVPGVSGTVVVVVVVVVFARAFAVVFFDDFEFSGGFIGSVLRVVVVEIAKLVTSILSSFRSGGVSLAHFQSAANQIRRRYRAPALALEACVARITKGAFGTAVIAAVRFGPKPPYSERWLLL